MRMYALTSAYCRLYNMYPALLHYRNTIRQAACYKQLPASAMPVLRDMKCQEALMRSYPYLAMAFLYEEKYVLF